MKEMETQKNVDTTKQSISKIYFASCLAVVAYINASFHQKNSAIASQKRLHDMSYVDDTHNKPLKLLTHRWIKIENIFVLVSTQGKGTLWQ